MIALHQLTMATSSRHAVLFTKENCGPCIKTKAFLLDLIYARPPLAQALSVMKIENHTSLQESYGLDTFPTLLIVGPNGIENERIVGGIAIRDAVEERLTEIVREGDV